MNKRKFITLLLAIIIALPMNVSAMTKDEASNWYYGNVSNWAKPELVSAVQKGIVMDQNLFADCSRNITREEFATLAVNLYSSVKNESLSVASEDSFTDTSDVNVLKAYNNGIINGVGDRKFAPNDPITREQMAVMIYNTAKLVYSGSIYTFSEGNGVLTVADKGTVSYWAAKQVAYTYNNGIITGDGINFNPKRNASIEQAVAIVSRVYDKLMYDADFQFKAMEEAKAKAEAIAEAKVKAEEEAKERAKAKAEEKAKKEAKERAKAKAEAEARKTRKFNVDDIISLHYGYFDNIKKFPYRYGYVFHLDGPNNKIGRKEGKLVLDCNMDRNHNWYTDVDMSTYLFLDKKDWYSDVGMMLRVNAMEPGANSHNGYYAGIRDDGDVVFGVHSIRSGWKSLKKFDTNVNPTFPNKLRVKAIGSNFTIYLNDKKLGTISDTTYSAGKVGLRTWDGYVYYYNTVVKDLD